MPEQAGPYPGLITLNGADTFLLQLDKLMQASTGKRNVCIFVLTLSQPLSLADVHAQLGMRPAYRWLCQLRLKTGLPFSLPVWQQDGKALLPAISEYHLASADGLPEFVAALDFESRKQSAFKIDLVQLAGAGSALVFSWHHALMDARGGEAFVRYLVAEDAEKPPVWLAEAEASLPLKNRADIALAMKQFLYDTSKLPLLSLYKKSQVRPKPCYKVMSFSQQESQLINERARQLNAGFLASAFYLAATAYAVAQVRKRHGSDAADVLVPVPLDRRKRGATGPVLGNQVSFLFYRIPNAVLADVSACTAELIGQMKTLLRTESPGHYTVMLDFLRRLPGFLYRRMLKAPTDGLMASFFYSDTGDSLQDFSHAFGQSINSAIHYPPNMYPPGLTFVFGRFQGVLQLTLGYMEPELSPADVDLLLAELRLALLGGEASPL